MESRCNQFTSKRIVYFGDKNSALQCTDDVVKICLQNTKYCAHNLNFINCFLNNTPASKQKFILHWGSSKKQYLGFKQDVFEIETVSLTKCGEHEAHYLIPAPVLFDMLCIPHTFLPCDWVDGDEMMERGECRDSNDTNKSLAVERMNAYNAILSAYCKCHGISFHSIEEFKRKNVNYMNSMRI